MASAEFEAAAEALAEHARQLSQSGDGTPSQLLQYALTLLPASIEVGWCTQHGKEHFLDADGNCVEDAAAD